MKPDGSLISGRLSGEPKLDVPPSGNTLYGRDYAARQIERSRSPWRNLIKSLYLARTLAHIDGPTLDYGCGAGQLLARLPAGSAGLEVNPGLIHHLRAQSLSVTQASGADEDLDLSWVRPGQFRTLVMAHVLEHFDAAESALQRLLAACRRVGIARVVIVVPGALGYRSDPTHRTFIDPAWLSRVRLPESFELADGSPWFFPGPAWVGRLFTYHETTFVIRDNPSPAMPPPDEGSPGARSPATSSIAASLIPTRETSQHPRLQALRFILTGTLNTALSYGLYAVFLWLGLHFSLASLLATLTTIVSGFVMHGRMVFGNREPGRFGRYAGVWMVLYGLNIALIQALTQIGLNAYMAGALALAPVTAAGFLLHRRYTFAGPPA